MDPQRPLTTADSTVWAPFHSSLLLAKSSSFGGGCIWAQGASITVIDEVIVAGLLGDGWRRVRDLNVFQVQEAELDFHAKQRVQVIPCQVTHHVFPQQRIQPICPDTVLGRKKMTMRTTDDNYKRNNNC